MPAKRVILELGTGNDLHGGDYTKAALRAVQDALHHSSLAMWSSAARNRALAGAYQNQSQCADLHG